jgi:hypothetical protein
MSGLRIATVLAAVAVMVPLGLHLGANAGRTFQALPRPAATASPMASSEPSRDARERKRSARRERRGRQPAVADTRATRPIDTPAPRPSELIDPGSARLLLLVALELAITALLIGLAAGGLGVRRARRRRSRRYELYELRLSTHDQAKPQDLEDMVEALANLVRAYPVERARDGQPHVDVELRCLPASGPEPSDGEAQWSLYVRCEPTVVDALDAAINAAYPDVRLGCTPTLATTGVPRHLLRLRKQRSFVYPLLAAEDALGSPPLEQIALAQVALDGASVVRFQLAPAPTWFEALARRLYRRHENKLVRAERWGLREGGLTSTLNRAEMRNAEQTQNRSLFWLELVVAADTRPACRTLAAAVQARRGENRLQRRIMIVRRGLYRRRFPAALGPLVPSPRALVSAAEVAHLLELPSARMKGVPVRRATVPRIPAPPDALRADDLDPLATPAAQPSDQPSVPIASAA